MSGLEALPAPAHDVGDTATILIPLRTLQHGKGYRRPLKLKH